MQKSPLRAGFFVDRRRKQGARLAGAPDSYCAACACRPLTAAERRLLWRAALFL
ncbi:30S ribosomal S20 domain protein [Burkholderia mallei]|nr:30S ribosomal S20 domain protein [Burkholderia mallei]KOT22914.1 30S ribosomal S20 domain protein [Burkholderia mallei]